MELSIRSKRSTTYEQFRDAIKDLEESSSDFEVPETPRSLARVFMGYWDPNDATAGMSYLKYIELKAKLRNLQKTYGCWRPPADVAKYLEKRPKPLTFTLHSGTEEERNLKFVLHILGVPPHDNGPFKQFLKAKTNRQRRLWLYKHLGPLQPLRNDYLEPICPTRLKRLYHFFPDQFSDEDGTIYFNHKILLYNETSNFFFLSPRWEQGDGSDDSESSEYMDNLTWRAD